MVPSPDWALRGILGSPRPFEILGGRRTQAVGGCRMSETASADPQENSGWALPTKLVGDAHPCLFPKAYSRAAHPAGGAGGAAAAAAASAATATGTAVGAPAGGADGLPPRSPARAPPRPIGAR